MKRLPKQERSKRIVDAVLAGATRVLAKARLKETTTNRIAEAAGVGIGSLYDYFPNKEGIVAALIDQRVESVVSEFKLLLTRNEGGTAEEKIEEVVAFFQGEFLERKGFLREIFFLAPASGRMESLYKARMEVSELVTTYLQKKLPNLQEQDARKRAFLMVHGSLGLVESYIMVDPNCFKDTDLAGSVRGLLKLFLGDLR